MILLSNGVQRKVGIILQYAQMIISISIQLIYTPIMLRILGQTEYGIYNVASSVISYLSLFSLGFGSSYLRFYTMYKNKNDSERLGSLNGLYLSVFFVIGGIAFVAGLFLVFNVEWFYNETYSTKDIEIARTLMVFLTVNLSVSFPSSVFVSYITSQEKFIFQKIVNIGKTIIGPVVNLILLYSGYGSIGMVVTTTCISLLIDVINIWFCFSKIGMKISFKNMDFHLLKKIFVFSIFIGINGIIDQINWQTDKILLGKIVNGTAVAVYAVGSQINMLFTQFSTSISSVYAPKVNRIVQGNTETMDNELTSLFIKIGRIQWFVLSLILSGFIFFGRFFVLKWAGDGYERSYYVALLLMSPALIPLIQNIGIEIQRAKNKHQFRSIVYLVMAILNVVISIFLILCFGEIGAALGTTISLVVANGIIMNIYYHKKLGINILEFWKSIISTIPGLVIPVAGGVCLMLFYTFNSVLDFCLLILVYVVVYAVSIFFLGFNKEEKRSVCSLVKKVFKII